MKCHYCGNNPDGYFEVEMFDMLDEGESFRDYWTSDLRWIMREQLDNVLVLCNKCNEMSELCPA